jgi:hypothetical protein
VAICAGWLLAVGVGGVEELLALQITGRGIGAASLPGVRRTGSVPASSHSNH